MLLRLCASLFIAIFVGLGVFGVEKRRWVHYVVLLATVSVLYLTVAAAIRHYSELRSLKTLDANQLLYVSIGNAELMTDPEQLQAVVQGLKEPQEFLASRSNHGAEMRFSLGFKNGGVKVFGISRAKNEKGVVLRIEGGGTAFYAGLDWIVPASL